MSSPLQWGRETCDGDHGFGLGIAIEKETVFVMVNSCA